MFQPISWLTRRRGTLKVQIVFHMVNIVKKPNSFDAFFASGCVAGLNAIRKQKLLLKAY